MSEIFVDGTFKCCPKYFEQLHTIHGFNKGHYVPLVYALLPAKTDVYTTLLRMILDLCSSKGMMLSLSLVHIDFELAMHNALRKVFPSAQIQWFILAKVGGDRS